MSTAHDSTEEISRLRWRIKWEEKQIKKRSRYRKAAMRVGEWSEWEEKWYEKYLRQSEVEIRDAQSEIKAHKVAKALKKTAKFWIPTQH